MFTTPDGSRSNRKLKVRTGCITCKIRKVKCDEEKPFCKRCTDTGRKCDGYAVPERRPHKNTNDRSIISWTQQRPSPPNPTHPKVRRIAPAGFSADVTFLSQALAGEERQWVGFFSLRTGPALSSAFSHSFWSRTLPQLSVSEPAIRHAMIALGSAHARFEAEAANNQVLASAVSPEFVLRHYNHAIKNLKEHLNRNNQTADIALLCCLMFISLECLYSNRPLVLDHLRNGLNLLRSSQSQDLKDQVSNAYSLSIRQQVRPIFHRLEAQSTLVGQPVSALFNDLENIPVLKVPKIFADFEEAKVSLDSLIASCLVFIRTVHDGKHNERLCARPARALQIHLLEQSNVWSNSVANLVRACNPFTDADDKREKILRVQHTATFIWLSQCTELDEFSFDKFLNEFKSIVEWSRILYSPVPDSADPALSAQLASLSISGSKKFSLNMAFIPPLYLVAIKCRDAVVRREAITILGQMRGREGLWDARLHAQVARRYVEIEESSTFLYNGAASAYMEEGPSMRMLVDGEFKMLTTPPDGCFRVYDAEIRDVSEGSQGTCNVTFHTAPNGMLEDRVIWKEKLHF